MSANSLATLRADFDRQANRSLSMPVAGALVWAAVGIAAWAVPSQLAVFILAFGTGAIFPIALLIAKIRKENLMGATNPLSRLIGLCILMVNLLWGLHLTLLFGEYSYFPLSLGIGLGLHWVVFSWIVDHPVGTVHAILRTGLVTGLWWLFPNHPIPAVALGVVIAYLYAIYGLSRRKLNR